MANTVYYLEWEDVSQKPPFREVIGGFSNQQKAMNAAEAHAKWLMANKGVELSEEWVQAWGGQAYWEYVVWDKVPDVHKTNPDKPKYYYSVRKLRIR